MLTFMNLRKLGLYTEQISTDVSVSKMSVSKMSVKDVKTKLADKVIKKTAFKGLCKKFNLVSCWVNFFVSVRVSVSGVTFTFTLTTWQNPSMDVEPRNLNGDRVWYRRIGVANKILLK